MGLSCLQEGKGRGGGGEGRSGEGGERREGASDRTAVTEGSLKFALYVKYIRTYVCETAYFYIRTIVGYSKMCKCTQLYPVITYTYVVQPSCTSTLLIRIRGRGRSRSSYCYSVGWTTRKVS